LRRGNDWPRPPSPPSKTQNEKIPDGGGQGFESSQEQQERDSVHRIGTATAAECSLARSHAQQNATQRRILQQEQEIESWIIIPISSELCTDILKLRLSPEKSANGAAAAAVLWSEGPDASGSHLVPHVIISAGAISSSSLSNHVCH